MALRASIRKKSPVQTEFGRGEGLRFHKDGLDEYLKWKIQEHQQRRNSNSAKLKPDKPQIQKRREGDPDSGKSYLSLALAAHVTTGRQIPFDKDRTASKLPRNVLMLVGEDCAADTIKPRFRKVAGEMSRLTLLEGLVTRGCAWSYRQTANS